MQNDSALTFNDQPLLTNFHCKIANMHIGENIKTLRVDRGWTQQNLADRVNVSRGRIGQIEKDPKAEIKGDTLMSLSRAFGCPPEVILGKAPLFGGDDSYASFSHIPVLNVELAAGPGIAPDLEQVHDRIPISSEWIFENQLPESSLAVVKVSGDSMLPRLMDGDMLLIDTSDKRPTSGKVYAIATDEELRVKRLHKRTDGSWVISSDNKHDPAYQDEIISYNNFERLRIIGRAVKVLMGDI